jgi:hypothetical protein
MLCARCDEELQVRQTAIACRTCSAGVCRTHLYFARAPSAPGGMGGMGAQRRTCLCLPCAEDLATSAQRNVLSAILQPLRLVPTRDVSP